MERLQASTFPRQISRPRYWLLAGGSFASGLALWSLLSYTHLFPAVFLPTPSAVVLALVDLFLTHDLARDVWVSTYRIVLGFAISALVAVPVGILVGAREDVEALVEPANDFIRYLPVVAFVPLCILWLGIGDGSKVLLIFIGTYFQLVLMVTAQVNRVRREFVEMALTLGAKERDIVLHIVVPASLPGIADSLRIAMGWAWSYLVVAELVAADVGVGFKIVQGLRFLKTDQVMAAMLVVGVLGLVFDLAFKLLHRLLFRWKTTEGD